MKDIRNERETFTINYMHGKVPKSMTLVRGITKNVPDDEVEAMKLHPTFKAFYESDKIEVLTVSVDAKLEFDEFKVVDSIRDGQPLPVFEQPKMTVAPDAPKPSERLPMLTKAQLLELDGIGEGYASKILNRQPEQGYSSFGELKDKNSDLTKLKDESWEGIREQIDALKK